MARRFPPGIQISALLAVLVLSFALLVQQGAGAARGMRTEAPPGGAAPREGIPLKPQATKIATLPSLAMEQLTPAIVTANGLEQSKAGWTVAQGGGSLVVRVRSALPLASLGASFALDQSLNPSVWIRSAGAWMPMSLAEPLERDGPHTQVVDPVTLPSGTRVAWLRFQVPRAGKPAVLSRLRVYGLPTVPAQSLGRPAPVPNTRTTLRQAGSSRAEGMTATSAPLTPFSVPTSSSLTVISRADWGSPDGESSPHWIPFFKQPYHIVIHHTDSGYSGDGSSDVRNIWAYHTFGNGWGDIGYNFVIDPRGNVYEGRAGGPTAVGAHTEHYNYGAIGISLIGNFDDQTPPPAMVKALVGLVSQLGNQYGINMEGVTDDGTLTFANLAGHRDFYATSCPGINVYRLIPALRTAVTRRMRSDARLVGLPTIYVAGGASSVALLRVQNTGTTTWNGRFSLRRLAGTLPGLPGGYNLPGIPPGGTVSVPLFLPALVPGQTFPTTWRVYDASGFPAGTAFPVAIHVLAAGQPTPVPPPPTATASPPAPPSPTFSPTASPTPTRVGTATATPSPSQTSSPTQSPTISPTVSGTPSPTATSLIQHLLPAGTGSPTSTPSPSPSPTQGSYLLPDARPSAGGASLSSAHDAALPRISDRQPSIAGQTNRVPRVDGAYTGGMPRQPRALNAVRGAARLWYFAEGSNAARDRETLAFVNPGSEPAYVVTTLVRADGRHAYVVTDVPPGGRATLDMTDAAGPGDGLGAIVRASQPLYVSRTEYHGSLGDEGTGAATTIGLRAPAPVWYLPAMPVIAGESERLSLLNPAATQETVRISLVTGGRLRPYQVVVVKALGIRAMTLPHGTASVEVRHIGAGSGVVVEARQSYQGDMGFTAASGVDTPTTSGYFAAPATGGPDSVVLLNPNAQAATVRLSGLDARSGSVWSRSLPVGADRQESVALPKSDGDWSAVYFQSDRPIAAGFAGLLAPGGEPSLAAHYRGMVTEEPTAPGRQHIFSEGDTRALISGPAERVYLVNPTNQAATISLNLLATGGRRLVKMVSLAPRATTSVNINAWAPPSQHALLVLSDQPILAAQTITFNLGADRLYSNGVIAP